MSHRDHPTELNPPRLPSLAGLHGLAAAILLLGATLGSLLAIDLNWLAVAGGLFGLMALAGALHWRARHRQSLGSATLAIAMLLDLLLMTLLIGVHGAASNPFVLCLLIPVALGAAILPARATLAVTLCSMLAYTSLLFVPGTEAGMSHSLANTAGGHGHGLMDAAYRGHLWGMWLAFLATAAFVAACVYWLAAGLRRSEARLAAYQRQQLRDQQILDMATLAASTAHQLGTPMSSMRVILEDLHDSELSATHAFELDTMQAELERCRGTLHRLTELAGGGDADGAQQERPLAAEFEALCRALQARCPEAVIQVHCDDELGSSPVRLGTGVRQSLQSLLDNAVRVSPQAVALRARREEGVVCIDIEDAGPGRAATLNHHAPSTGARKEGLGVGILLARASLERLGGTLRYGDRDPCGVIAQLRLPWAAIRGESSA